ncbi:MAG TPA: hypothetical protein VFZ10_15370 [Geminicoccaceae bacterium]
MTDAPRSAGLVALADRIELWPIDRLRPYERNPRTHSEAQLDQIAASMVEFGWTNPVAWRDGLKPDPLLTVSEWADRYRVLSQRASSEPGRWRTERTPYLRDHGLPVAVFRPLQRVALMKGAQIGRMWST